MDYDALAVLMRELSGSGEPDWDAVGAAWDAIGPRGQQMASEDATLGPKLRERGLEPGARTKGASGLLGLATARVGATLDTASGWAQFASDWLSTAGNAAKDVASGARDTASTTRDATLHAVSSAKEGIRDRVAAFMKWYGGEGHAAEQEPTPEPQAEVKPEPEGPSYQDNLGIAAGYLQTRTAYQWGASEKDWEKGSFDCSSFTLNTMQKAGYDIQETVRFDPSTALPEEVTPEERDAATKGAYSATVYDFTHMTEEALPELAQARMDAGDREVEEILARYHVEKRGGIDARVGKLPEGPDKARALSLREKARAAKVAKLRELVEAGDPRTMGAVQAMELAEYGQRVELNEVKPGDVVQTWNLYENGRIFGHSTQVFAILCEAILLDEDGKPGKAQPVRIDGDTDPATVYAVPRVVSAELIGAHMAGTDSSGQRHSGGVYVKPPEKLTPKEPPEKLTPEDEGGRFDKVYVGRLSGSRWASWEPGA